MKFETTPIDGIKIRFAASRNEGMPQLLLTSPQPMADLLPNSRFDVIPGAAHYAWEDNPSDYLDKVLRFIEEVEATADPAP